MNFDENARRLAQAHDAVDRLREIQKQIIERHDAAERRRDLAVRAVLLVVVALTVFAAFNRL